MLALVCACPFLIKVDDKYIKELIDVINSGKYISVSSDRVRQIRGEYFEIGEDGELTLIDDEDIKCISEDGTVYIKSRDKAQEDKNKVDVLDGKHYIEEGDGTFKEVQIQAAPQGG